MNCGVPDICESFGLGGDAGFGLYCVIETVFGVVLLRKGD